MRISENSHHLKKTSLWDNEDQADPETEITTSDILARATATFRASLGEINPQDIWDALGRHLLKQLCRHKAVNITDFGAFGFTQNDEPVFVQDPVFLHMTRLCLASRKLGNQVQPALTEIENVATLDLNDLHVQNCSKDLVKSVISSVMAWVVAWAKDGQDMRLSFLPMGEWICMGNSVDFKFSGSFRKEFELMKAKEEKEEKARLAEVSADSDTIFNNQFEGQDPAGDQFDFPAHSARTGATSDKMSSYTGKALSSVGTSASAAKENTPSNRSLVGHSRYKLRAPTFSSLAKQLPPHGQRHNRIGKGPRSSSNDNNTNNKTKATPSKQAATRRVATPNSEQLRSASPTFAPSEIEAVTRDIVTAVKNARPSTAASSRICKSIQSSKSASHLTTPQMDIVDRLRKRICNRKPNTMQGLNAIVTVLSPFKTGSITSTELSLSLRKVGVKISSAELKEITLAFAHEKRGYVDIKTLLSALRGPPMSAERLDLVARAFRQFDPSDSGSVHVDEMLKHYDVGILPQVREGKQSRMEALTAFLQEWASIDTPTANTITFETFVEYYHNVSACIGNDEEFTRLMCQAWHIPEETQEEGSQSENGINAQPKINSVGAPTPGTHLSFSSQTENQSHAAESPTGSKIDLQEETSPNEVWSYLRALLLFPQPYLCGVHTYPTADKMCRRLGANRVLGDNNETMNVKAFANELMLLDKRLSHKKAFEFAHLLAAHCGKGPDDSDTIVLLSLFRKLMTITNEPSSVESSGDYNYVEYYASRAIERIRARLQKPRSSGFDAEYGPPVDLNTLEKWFQTSSSNGDSLLLKYELRSALQKVGIDISYQDLDYLFAYFDVDRQGFINYESLLDVLRSSSSALPKLTKRPEITMVTHRQDPVNAVQYHHPITLPMTVSPLSFRKRMQAAARKPQPDYRRRNTIQRAIYDQTRRPTATDVLENLSMLEIERRWRYRAARLIQKTFRAFRARHVVAQLRRNAAAKSYRFSTLAQEHQQWLAKKEKTSRTALPTAYGF